MAELTITSITTKTGAVLTLPPIGVLCIVGGNNVGKSQFLRDILVAIERPGPDDRTVLIDEVDFKINLKAHEAKQWFVEHSVEVKGDSSVPKQFYSPSRMSSCSPLDFEQWLLAEPRAEMGMLKDWFIRTLDASERSSVAISRTDTNPTTELPPALRSLLGDGDRTFQLSKICEKSFGFPLTLDRVTGDVMLRVGRPKTPTPPLDHPTTAYTNEVRNLPPLHEQGDGVKNYLGMVLHMMTGVESVTIFDEPEAFLHPAQARALGRHLGDAVQEGARQLITATHDRDFLLGLLDSGVPLTVVRIDRHQNHNRFTSIDSNTIAGIWANPALRYSNLLQGLFHRTVVLCEAAADCQWFAAIADVLGSQVGISSEEILFVPGGGKHQFPASLEALNALDVQVFTIADFDAILEPDLIQKLLRALEIEDQDLIDRLRRWYRNIMNDNRRTAAKESGLSGLAGGTSSQIGKESIDSLRNHGILIVPVGEMESFDKTLGGEGSMWVNRALTARIHETNLEAHSFMQPVIDSLSISEPPDWAMHE